MSKPIIHFSHANGFPAETYRKLFSYLEKDFQIGYISMHGHNPNYPINHNWAELVDELIHYIEKNYDAPVDGVGHSLGGVLTFIAAIKRPEIFRKVVLLDSLITSRTRSFLLFLAKKLNVLDAFTPARRVKTRRVEWGNFEEALAYFHSKTLFKEFDPDCLEDYVRYGTQVSEKGIKLRFDRNIEYEIFHTIPHNLTSFSGHLRVPATVIYSKAGSIMHPIDLLYLKRKLKLKCRPIQGTHMFPFEYPELTAEMIRETLVSK